MSIDDITDMGSGLSDSSQHVDRRTLRKVGDLPAPSCQAIVDFILSHGINTDVHADKIKAQFNLNGIRGQGIGSYLARINGFQRVKGQRYRIVLGMREKTYRIIKLI